MLLMREVLWAVNENELACAMIMFSFMIKWLSSSLFDLVRLLHFRLAKTSAVSALFDFGH